MLRDELVHHIYHDVRTGEVLLLTREPENVRGCHTAGNRPESEPGRWIREVPRIILRTSKIRRPCQRSHFKAAE